MGGKTKLRIAPDRFPRVLFIGNGLLQLTGGMDWEGLLQEIKVRSIPHDVLDRIPFAMQPEALCGSDIDDVQLRTASRLSSCGIHDILRQLVSLDFDAILTTNYTYEIEEALTGHAWSADEIESARRVLHGSPNARYNTCMCSMVDIPDGRRVPVFHLHGEQPRRQSLVLSYYSYANTVHRLIDLNRERGNDYCEHQQAGQPLTVWSWLDYFLIGDVYAVGFGFNFSEFDIWWAIERKSRENARHGTLYGWFSLPPGSVLRQRPMFEALDAVALDVPVINDDYAASYRLIYDDLKRRVAR